MPDDLHDLQVQSDQLRIDFLRKELEVGFTFATLARSEAHLGNHEHAARSAQDAKKAVRTLERYLSDPKHSNHIPQNERREIAAGIEKLHQILGLEA